jgi:pimeloyl-ACP methyl ester carboxylesterase
MIRVGGHSMRVRTATLAERKTGQPVVILESGALSPLENWDPVFDQIAAIAPVIAYDRRGVGKSEFDGEPQTLKHVASSLHALLAQLKVVPPYVLVGHSYGGILIRAFAQEYPAEIRGLVYLDAPDIEMTYAEMDAISPGAREAVFGDLQHMPRNLPPGLQAEVNNIRQLMDGDMGEARALHPPTGIPTGVIVSAGKYLRSPEPPPVEIGEGLVRLQIRHEQEWALSSPQGMIVIARHVSHYVHRDDPALALEVIRHVLGAATPHK